METDLNLIGELLRAIEADIREIHSDITAIRAEVSELSDGQTVLSGMVFRLERDMVQVKRMLGNMDARIAHLEQGANEVGLRRPPFQRVALGVAARFWPRYDL